MSEFIPLANPPWKYFSKFHKKWINAKVTDCKKSLIKYHYKIIDTPKMKKL